MNRMRHMCDPADLTVGDQVVNLLQEQLERRAEGKGQPRHLVWDDDIRGHLRDAVDEVMKHVRADFEKQHGLSVQQHAEEHQGIGELLPWLKAQRIKAERQAAFWQALIDKNAERAISWSIWALAVSAALGFSGAWRVLFGVATGGPQ